MADRNSAEIFGTVFMRLARVLNDYDETGDTKQTVTKIARDLWPKTGEYDFSLLQMDCDEALLRLGLARRDGDAITYAPRDLTDWYV